MAIILPESWQQQLAKDCSKQDYDKFMKNLKMKPSEQCKQAGIKGLAELATITGCSVQTLNNWHKHKADLFRVVIAGAVQLNLAQTMKEFKEAIAILTEIAEKNQGFEEPVDRETLAAMNLEDTKQFIDLHREALVKPLGE